MTFEALVRDKAFASQVVTTAVGRLNLDRPTEVSIANAQISVDTTGRILREAHERSVSRGAATMVYGLAIPFVGFEDERATDVKPDFAIVSTRTDDNGEIVGSWLIVGDAKDYERVRSRIDDSRLLKGFLQVALGAESASSWSQLPAGMNVHRSGALAVPRNAFLQPEALVEPLDDHRNEVRMRISERREESAAANYDGVTTEVEEYVGHLRARFDPSSCSTCTLFGYCRAELRKSDDVADLLIEIGVPEPQRPQILELVTTGKPSLLNVGSMGALVEATITGVASKTQQARVDQISQPGTVNVVLAKSDSAALGVYGMATQRVGTAGVGEWKATVFNDPQSPETRRKLMKILGNDLNWAMKDRRRANRDDPDPVHIVVPDRATADLLSSAADNLAGIELSRLRWERDKDMNRPALTFDGELAQVPRPLSEVARTAVSFLLEEDRARAFSMRTPVIDLRKVMAGHFVTGGPAVNALRLDYMVGWANATPEHPVDHRAVSDEIEAGIHTPGARLTNRRSDQVHRALVGERGTTSRPAAPAEYEALIVDELEYKTGNFDKALGALDRFPESNLREVYRAIEKDAQAVWRRRLRLHASDLVRFGRTYRHWRNSLVPTIEGDSRCSAQLLALTNPQSALDSARDAGSREISAARVIEVDPLVIEVDSRRIGNESRIALLHVEETSCVESDDIEVKFQKGSFKITGLSIGPLEAIDKGARLYEWSPAKWPKLKVDDELIIADFHWFGKQSGNNALPVARPATDLVSAPQEACGPTAYGEDPDSHKYCCRPHEIAESEWSDILAERRANGELNPEKWPPVVDSDAFEVSPDGRQVGDPTDRPAELVPDHITADDLD